MLFVGLLLLILIILLLLFLFNMMAPVTLTYYYSLPIVETVQVGVPNTDPVAGVSQLFVLYSDETLTNEVGYVVSDREYVTYANNKSTFIRNDNVHLHNGNRFFLKTWKKYLTDSIDDLVFFFENDSLVVSSNKTKYIGRKYDNRIYREGVGQLVIGL